MIQEARRSSPQSARSVTMAGRATAVTMSSRPARKTAAALTARRMAASRRLTSRSVRSPPRGPPTGWPATVAVVSRPGGLATVASSTNASSAVGSAIAPGAATSAIGRPSRSRLTGTSIFLPVSVRGIAGTVRISSGTWRGDRSRRIAAVDPASQAVVERRAWLEGDEQRHPVAAVRPFETDDEAVGNLGDRLDDPVELARPEADAAAVERRVRAALDDRAASLGDPDPVTVAPDPRERLEVALPVAVAIRIVPEHHRHRRQRGGQDELAGLADDRPARLVERLDPRTQRAALELAGVDRQERTATDEGRDDVRPAADGRQPDVGLDVVVDPPEAVDGQRGAGRADAPQVGEVVPFGRSEAGLGAGRDIRRADAEEACPSPFGE